MRKNYLCKVVFIFLFSSFHFASAQDFIISKSDLTGNKYNSSQKQQEPDAVKPCYTFKAMKEFQKKYPNAITTQQFENFIKQKLEAKKNSKVLDQDYVIPVIFHVIHNGENVGTGSNISVARLQDQIVELNKGFANLFGSTWLDPNIAADIQIQFCVAKVDPQGKALAIPGIERINRNTAGFTAPPFTYDYMMSTVTPATIWDPYSYFNVWVIDTDEFAGVATFPSTPQIPGLFEFETDLNAGVIMYYGAVGSPNNPGNNGSNSIGRILVHEAGHFLGLRHIWGDNEDEQGNQTACGSDYCDDTPTQTTNTNFNCPNPRPVSCNNIGNMIENHMDYSSDICKNTFTIDQKARMQTVMLNSPRRITLATSQVCTAIPVNNSIAFTTFATPVTETGGLGVCPRYKEFNLTLKVSGAATGNATVTFTALNGSTATPGKDYIVIPAAVNYINGDAADKMVTVRVFDDQLIENNELINLSYNIVGNGVVPGVANQVNIISITDDDVTPIISHLPVTLLDENFGTLNNPSDLSDWAAGSFTGVGINEWTISENGGADVVGLSAHITQDVNTNPNTYSLTSASDVVLITPLINPGGNYKEFTLSFKFKSNGEKVGNTFRDYGRIYYSLDGNSFNVINDVNNVSYNFQGVTQMEDFTATLPAALDNKSFFLGFRWTNNNSLGNNPPFTIDDIKIDAAQGRNVETEVAESKIATVNNADEIYFISPVDGDVITKIKNANTDIGCVTAGLSAAGNAKVDITTTGGIFKRTQKVLQIIPEVPNNNATYQGTLYFTAAELAVWGPEKLNLKILKIKDGVDLNGLVQAGDVEVIVPTNVTEFVNEGYIAYTADFTGFSQFMLAQSDIILPIQLLGFQARPLQTSIQLDWSTASENNNKGFKIERSEDGNVFNDIGWVDGKGNSSNEQKYRYEDKQIKLNTTYYYRLRQMDFDAAEKVSETRIARIGKDETVVQVRPNPTAGIIKLQVLSSANVADIEVYNAKGQKIISKPKTALNGQMIELNLSGYAQGVYNVVVTINNRKISTPVIKQ